MLNQIITSFHYQFTSISVGELNSHTYFYAYSHTHILSN